MREADEFIINRVLGGDQNAYALLVDRYKDRVFSLVLGIVKNYSIAEEVAQDVFLNAYNGLKKFRMESGFSTWIYRIAYNTAISETRKKKYNIKSFDEQLEKAASIQVEDTPGLAEEKESKQKLLEQALEKLAPEDKLILMLFYFENKSVEEISKATKITASNVKVKLYRLRNRLKEIMTKIGNVELAVY
jgi:RNA polymerase sigma-70 factor (ECF subfamily)